MATNKKSNTPPTPPSLVTFESRKRAFEADEKRKAGLPTASPETAANSKNPYLRARMAVLASYEERNMLWRKQEVLRMEIEENTDNRHYMDFVKEVVILGDKFSDGEDLPKKS